MIVVGHVSTFPPLRCGIASFVSDLIDGTPFARHVRYSLHYGNDAANAVAAADVRFPEQLVALGKCVSEGPCDVVSLQHEFGIWGGAEGENILPFLENVTKPIVSILHTTFGPEVRSGVQNRIIRRLVEASVRVVVLTESAQLTLSRLLGRWDDKVVMIPHGVPSVNYQPHKAAWSTGEESVAVPLKLITPGFYREDKGLETILLALRRLIKLGRSVSYVIAGQPQRQFLGQDSYRDEIEHLVTALGLDGVVTTDCRYLTVAEQIDAIRESHAGLFAYQDPHLASSGTVPLVLSVGRPVICTPFEYATAAHKKSASVRTTANFGAAALADCIIQLMDEAPLYEPLARVAYDDTRQWCWTNVGVVYANEYAVALTLHSQAS